MAFRKQCFLALTFVAVIGASIFTSDEDDANLDVDVNKAVMAKDAVANCTEGEFYCDGDTTNSGLCIPLAFKCDGDIDCEDATDEPSTCPKGRVARSPKKNSTKKPKKPRPSGGEGPSGGKGKHHVPCSVTCTNGGHTPTCCDAHGLSGGKCVGEKAFCT